LAAALIVALIVTATRSNQVRDRTLAAERHAYDVMLIARSADAAMAQSEAALGRFAVGSERSMGDRYYNDWLLAGSLLDTLEQQVGADPVEVKLVRHLRSLYEARGKELGVTATRAYYKQGWPALLLFNDAGHSRLIGEIDRTVDAILKHERAVLGQRYIQSDASAHRATKLLHWLAITGLLLILAAGTLAILGAMAMGHSRRATAEAEAADDRALWLEHAVAERTRELSDANARLQTEMAERAAAEARLRQIQKMEAVGQLTGGIAHDFNNMLAVVVGGLDLAKRRLETEVEEVARHIDNAMDGANRAASLTRRLLGFARAEPLLPEAIDPGDLIRGMSDLIDRTLGERVTIETPIAPDLWPVWADPLQLENAILNLAVNARDAMEGAGRLTIEASNIRLAPREVGETPGGDHVRIAVRDTGCGMTPEVRERVFEPFFTTKEVGKGTGLGLSQVFGFVRQSGGAVAIESAPGEGTTVALYLPRDAATARTAPAAPIPLPMPAEDNAPSAPTGEPVLLVEDDPRVRASTAGALAEIGYLPVVCESGEEALAALDRRSDIRLVISDVVMPGMTGPELHAALRERHPGLAMLFVTGYAGEAGESGLEGEAVLRKPFTVSALERAVAAALARADVSAPRRARGAEAAR